MNKWNHQEVFNNPKLVGMVKNMSTLNINIRLTIFFNPNHSGIINYSSSLSAIEIYLIPWLKKHPQLYSNFLFQYGKNWSELNLFDISKYVLKLTYS